MNIYKIVKVIEKNIKKHIQIRCIKEESNRLLMKDEKIKE